MALIIVQSHDINFHLMNATSDKINYIVSSILLTIINVYIDQKLVSYWILSDKGMAGNIMHWKAMSAVASQ